LCIAVVLGVAEKPLGAGFRCLAALGGAHDLAKLDRPVVERDGHLGGCLRSRAMLVPEAGDEHSAVELALVW